MLVELGCAERRTNGPAAAGHLRAGLEPSPSRRAAARSRSSWGARLVHLDRIGDAFAVFEQALDEMNRERDPTFYELLLAELISSAWSDPQTFPIGEAAIGEFDLDALHGGLGSEILLATMAHYEYRLGLRRERAVELASRALAPGNLLASGSTAFHDTVVVLAGSGFIDEAVSILDQAVAQAAGVGHPQRRVDVEDARQAADRSRRSSSSGRGSAGGRSISPSPTAYWSPGPTTSDSWRMRCWSVGTRARRRA